MKKYIMALDAGTTSNRCILFNEQGVICSVAQKEFTQHYPKAGWVEHDPLEIYASQYGVLVEVLDDPMWDEEQKEMIQESVNGGHLQCYLFQCLHCGKHLVWMDCD